MFFLPMQAVQRSQTPGCGAGHAIRGREEAGLSDGGAVAAADGRVGAVGGGDEAAQGFAAGGGDLVAAEPVRAVDAQAVGGAVLAMVSERRRGSSARPLVVVTRVKWSVATMVTRGARMSLGRATERSCTERGESCGQSGAAQARAAEARAGKTRGSGQGDHEQPIGDAFAQTGDAAEPRFEVGPEMVVAGNGL